MAAKRQPQPGGGENAHPTGENAGPTENPSPSVVLDNQVAPPVHEDIFVADQQLKEAR